MKYSYLFLIIFIGKMSFCQDSRNSNVSFEVVCYERNVLINAQGKVIFKLINNSDSTLQIPKYLSFGKYNQPGIDIGFDIVYLSSDTLKRINSIDHMDKIEQRNLEYDYLNKNEEKLIEEYIPNAFFWRTGVYKIRFIFHAENFIKSFSSLVTGWVLIEVNK